MKIVAFILTIVSSAVLRDFSSFYRSMEVLEAVEYNTPPTPIDERISSLFSGYYKRELVNMIDDMARQGMRHRVSGNILQNVNPFEVEIEAQRNTNSKPATRRSKFRRQLFSRFHKNHHKNNQK